MVSFLTKKQQCIVPFRWMMHCLFFDRFRFCSEILAVRTGQIQIKIDHSKILMGIGADGVLRGLLDLRLLPDLVEGDQNIENQIRVVFAFDHADIMHFQTGIHGLQRAVDFVPQVVQFRVVCDDGVIVDGYF